MTMYNNNSSYSPRSQYIESRTEMIGYRTTDNYNNFCNTPPQVNGHPPLVPIMNCRPQAPQTNSNEKHQLSPKFNEYQPLETIGMGSFGKIVRVRRRGDMKTTFVWKELNYQSISETEKDQIVSEVKILKKLTTRNHPCIIRYVDRLVDDIKRKVFIVMEYCENGDLASLIECHKRGGPAISESFIWKIMGQIVSALSECHRQNTSEDKNIILHRDLKPANILLDRHMNAKLCDFGLAIEMTKEDYEKGGIKDNEQRRKHSSRQHYNTDNANNAVMSEVACGTPLYMAPERISNHRYDDRSDVWSLGCVMYELASLRHPFEAENEQELIMRINEARVPEIPCSYSSELNKACVWMLRRDFRARPRIDNICGLPQLQLTLREIQCSMHESYLNSKSSSLNFHFSRQWKAMRQREQYLKREEARLRQIEIQLREKESLLAKRLNSENPDQSTEECHIIESSSSNSPYPIKRQYSDVYDYPYEEHDNNIQLQFPPASNGNDGNMQNNTSFYEDSYQPSKRRRSNEYWSEITSAFNPPNDCRHYNSPNNY